jgi:hypothetical protein
MPDSGGHGCVRLLTRREIEAFGSGSGGFAQGIRYFCDKGGEAMINKRTFITARRAQYAVSTLCRLPEVSPGWFYGFRASQPTTDQRQADREAWDEELLSKIKIFFKVSKKCYGSKHIHQALLADGEIVSERLVARIMKKKNVSASA